MRHVRLTPLAPMLAAVLLIALSLFGTRQISAVHPPVAASTAPLVLHELHDSMLSHAMPDSAHVMASASCTPRPRIEVSTRVEQWRLLVEVSATTSSTVPTNAIQSLKFGAPTNARVLLQDQTAFTVSREVRPSAPSAKYTFSVERTGNGAASVPFVVIDACGEWSTFVGAGTAALPLAPTPTPTPTQGTGPTPRPSQTPLPTSTPQPAATPRATLPPQAAHDTRFWHAPTDHEHGDAPPQWIIQAGYSVAFDQHGGFHGNTSSAENTSKHAAMKGFSATFKGVDVYFRVHIASNVLDRMARYHSYEVWARDASGGVSHWQGWFNSGDPVADRVSRTQPDPGRRPVVLVVDAASLANQIGCEQWYGATASWSWDFGWTICGTTTVFYPGENGQPGTENWVVTGANGAELRRLEAAWYDNSYGRYHPVGTFWATQFGEGVTGPSDPRCSQSTTRYGVSYQNLCLEQYIAPTMTEVAFPDNAIQKPYGASGLRLPN